MDQAFTLRNLMSERAGNPLGALTRFPNARFLVPKKWRRATPALLMALAERVRISSAESASQKRILLVDVLEPDAGFSRMGNDVAHVGAANLRTRLDEDLAEVMGIQQIWVMVPYLESEREVAWISGISERAWPSSRATAAIPETVLMYETGEVGVLDAFRQLRTLSSRCGVNSVSGFALGRCQDRDAAVAQSRLVEMGNRCLRTEVNFLGKLQLNAEEILLHWKAGVENESSLVSIANKFRTDFRFAEAKDQGEVRQ